MTRYALLSLAFLLVGNSYGQVVIGVTAQDAGARDRVLAVAKATIGQTEKTGNNDGAFVDSVLATVGLEGTGAPWCATFNRYCYDKAGFRMVGPRSALASKWVSNPTWTLAKGGATPKQGDPFGLWFSSKNRIAHTGLVWVWGTKTVRTIEGNTSPDAAAGSAADRDGGGVYSKIRLIRQIHSVRNWLD